MYKYIYQSTLKQIYIISTLLSLFLESNSNCYLDSEVYILKRKKKDIIAIGRYCNSNYKALQ